MAKKKYNKKYLEAWKCDDCEFEWAYETVRCPLCTSEVVTKII